MRVRVAAFGGLALAACVVSACRRAEEPPLQGPNGPSVAERVRVLNGDVFVIDGQHVRLADAVAPQPIPAARCWAEALAAKQATAQVRELMHAATDLRVEPTGRTDSYNRTVARVLLDNQDLAALLHDQGLVATTSKGRFGWCDPISQGESGAPAVRSLMDFSRG